MDNWQPLTCGIYFNGELKELDMAGLSMDTWKTRWTEHIDSERQRVNDSIPG